MTEVLVSAMVGIILQYINVLDQHIIHKYTMFYLNYISIRLGKKWKSIESASGKFSIWNTRKNREVGLH